MASIHWFKRPASIIFIIVLIILIVVLIRIHTYAWPWLVKQPEARVACEEVAWSMALTIDIVRHLETLYLPHAEALLSARQQLDAGKD